MSLLSRAVRQLSRDQAELEADELAAACARPGCVPVAEVAERDLARVTGVVHSLAEPPADRTPQLQVELYDGTGTLRLVWLGRRRIEGIRTGAYLAVSGRVTRVDGRLTVFNPAYELLPSQTGDRRGA